MSIKIVTMTGADHSVHPEDLLKLSKDFPFVEWAILVSPGSTGKRSRFPSISWIEHLLAVTKEENVNLSLHLCGGYVKQFMKGEDAFVNELETIWDRFTRVQINTHAERHDVLPGKLLELVNHYSEKEFIFQNDEAHDDVLAELIASGLTNFSSLFDMSHGAGILPTTWPCLIPDVKCGYAGGIGPDNVMSQVTAINNIVKDVDTWIDMETKVRTGEQKFDLSKVKMVLQQCDFRVSRD